ncbi:hypothetical protein VHEMI01648 [[Torrubiella] hemipterigena]|uniref:Uncharacterized protein n=1 Tax=[Torrubiella] hemipterigena TaxID=1531966 RepID=A0A0A1T5E7_9HYPO|nr:hypothetical protein VHEMI01648 [[Torrubiella] hemipterigena]
MQFMKTLLLTMVGAVMALPAPGADSADAALKKKCDCAAFKKCNQGCGAFNNGAGQGGGFCTSACYSSSHCGQNHAC